MWQYLPMIELHFSCPWMLREVCTSCTQKLRWQILLNFFDIKHYLKSIISFGGDLLYQQFMQKKVYKSIRKRLDLIEDHKIGHLEAQLRKNNAY